jgi:hypothetical protein
MLVAMRVDRVFGTMAMSVATLFGGFVAAAPADAAREVALNGTYRVFSDGEWARRDEVLFDVPSETQCTGTVTSNLGWTGSARLDDFWFIEHDIPKWAPCPDGTFARARQTFLIFGFDPVNEERVVSAEFLQGRNITKAPSGSCGRNANLDFELPVRVERISR